MNIFDPPLCLLGHLLLHPFTDPMSHHHHHLPLYRSYHPQLLLSNNSIHHHHHHKNRNILQCHLWIDQSLQWIKMFNPFYLHIQRRCANGYWTYGSGANIGTITVSSTPHTRYASKDDDAILRALTHPLPCGCLYLDLQARMPGTTWMGSCRKASTNTAWCKCSFRQIPSSLDNAHCWRIIILPFFYSTLMAVLIGRRMVSGLGPWLHVRRKNNKVWAIKQKRFIFTLTLTTCSFSLAYRYGTLSAITARRAACIRMSLSATRRTLPWQNDRYPFCIHSR